MTAGVPVSLGLATPASGTSLVLTTTADSPAGQAIAVFAFCPTASTNPSSVTDSAGNTYTQVSTDAAGASVSFYVCGNALALPLGGTITANFAGAAAFHGLGALTCPGILAIADPHDISSGAATGNSTSSTLITTATLAQSDEILFFGIGFSGTITAWTPSAGWIPVLAQNASAFGQVAYQIVSATTAVTASSTWGTTRNYKGRVWSLKGDGILPPSPPPPPPTGGAVVGGRRRQILGRTKPQAESRWTRETPPEVIKPEPVVAPRPPIAARYKNAPPARNIVVKPPYVYPKVDVRAPIVRKNVAKPTGPTWADMERARVELTRLRQELADQQDEDDVELLLVSLH